MITFKCKMCGGDLSFEPGASVAECPYCGNQAIIAQSFEGIYRPEVVIPFAVDKGQATAKLQEFVKGKKLLPKSFTENNRIEKVTGLYVPFWLYSCHAKGAVTFEGVKTKHWEDSRYKYEKEDHYHVVRRGEMDFRRIPADASSQMDDAMMDSLEPYDFSKAVSYDAAYFSGYLADRYDVKQKEAQPRANDRVENTFQSKMREAVDGYTSVTQKSKSIQLSNAKAEYAMLPVWMMSTKYEDRIYSFGINGQSGKMVGSLPVDKGKYFKYMGLAAVIALAVMQLFVYFLGKHSFTVGGEAVALVVSALIGWLYAQHLKSTMSTVETQHSALGYMVENSLHMGPRTDRFLFSKTNRQEKQKQGEQN